MAKEVRFSDKKTVSGYPADQVISALQKEIRRGNLESACFFGLELLESGLEDKFWARILVISVEDVNDTNAIMAVKVLRNNYYDLANAKHWDRKMQALKAIHILCSSKKDRIIGELHDYLTIKRKEGMKLKIPDYAIDMHTKQGKELGRDYLHFLQISSKVNKKDSKYKKELVRIAKEKR